MTNIPPERPDGKSFFKQLLDASSIGIQFVISTFVGFAIGYFLDKFFSTSPWLTILFLTIGIISGFRELLLVARKQNEHDKENN